MEYFRRTEPKYTALEEGEYGSTTNEKRRHLWGSTHWIISVLAVVAISVCAYIHWPTQDHTQPPTEHGCDAITLRKEWRTLTLSQKHEYISAVQCLKTRPSKLNLNHSLYDDFPWVHSRVGEYVHNAAPFLAWHRYFLHIYETSLKEECAYTGSMPYWNWELDWTDVTKAPVWDSETGFGSNGESSISQGTVLNGYCVDDGPFRHLEIPYLDEKYYPHCLSRGFLSGDELRNQSENLSPQKMEEVLGLEDYNSFNLGLENGPHLAIPRSIRGDFSLLTAPSDPVFFLHHAQLDRVWWRWQAIRPARKLEYEGAASHGSEELADVTDVLDMGELAPMISVSDVLDAASGTLCYTY